MCGICGLWSAAPEPVSDAVLERMNARIIHRGPDDSGSLAGDGIGLAMRRLKILDLHTGNQPIWNEDRSIAVVFNGEIYNYRDLRSQLAARGHRFSTQSDTEVLVHGYEEWGMDMLPRLNGMFAFALWDSRQDALFLVRDRLGEKPLYYAVLPDQVAFASEIKSLLEHPELGLPGADPHALQLYLLLGYVPAPYTMFKGIKKLMPGTFLRLQRGTDPQEVRYWDVNTFSGDYDQHHSENAPVETFTELFMHSIRMRLVADVPVGILLSGGLDSSSVMAGTQRMGGEAIKSFSVAFPDKEISEASFARTAANAFGSEHFELMVGDCSPDLLRQVVWHADEPLADPALVPTYQLCKLAREHVKVVLSGEGADELFAGYFYYPRYKDTLWLNRLPRGLNPQYAVFFAQAFNRLSGRQRWHPRTLWSWTLPPQVRELAWSAIFTLPELKRFFSPASLRPLPNFDPLAFLGERGRTNPGDSWMASLFSFDLQLTLVDGLLMKVDKMSMAASIEARTPFLDHRLVEFARRLPEAYKLGGQENKRILRLAMQDILPPQISSRKKHPFHVPIGRWMQKDLYHLFWDTLQSERFRSAGLLDEQSLYQLWQDMVSGVPGRAHQLWLVFSLALWAELYQVNLTSPDWDSGLDRKMQALTLVESAAA
jgi:asparagine synthase (glutamine-hydrolysing)